MKWIAVLAFVVAAAPAAAQQPAPADVLAEAREQIAAHKLDSAATLLRRLAEAATQPVPDRVQAWVLLAIVGFYRSGDSAAAQAFRQALALEPGLQVAALDRFDPALPQILAAERAVLAPPAAPAGPAVAVVYDCLRKCPAGVRPPSFTYFPPIDVRDTPGVLGPNGLRTYIELEVLIGANGTAEIGTALAGGSARGAEAPVRQALGQARFEPGRAEGVPVRTRVVLRFDFEAEGQNTIRYTYRVVAR